MPCVRTVIETPTFQQQAEKLWMEDERLDFIAFIAQTPEAGDVVPGAGGARKVRWSLPGTGKRGGVREIYFNYAHDGTVLLVMMYAKSARTAATHDQIKRAK